MIKAICGIVIGLLVFGTGLFYLFKEKSDKESLKIYSIISGAGFAVALISTILLFLNH
ncbi:MAG: hypothetical protein IJP61_02720 [Treponema sp.]|nr:hypothetical protein [Treponema sp.]